jgi:hypothetical protein
MKIVTGKSLLFSAILTAGLTTGTVSAQAALVSYTGMLTGSSSDQNFSPADALPAKDGSISLPLFNSAQGIVNSVTLDLSSAFTYVTRFENTSPVSGSTISKSLDQRLTIGSLLDTGRVPYTLVRSVAAADGVTDFAGASGFSQYDTNGVTAVHLTFSGADMAPYIGEGSLLLDVFSYTRVTGGYAGSNSIVMNGQSFTTSATITYDVTPTPIPAAVWLLGTGLLSIAGLRRKRYA